MMTSHLSETTAAAYVDGRLARAELRAAEAHLADCAECRAEILDITRIERPKRRTVVYLAPLAAAALLILFALPRPQPPKPILRGSEGRMIHTTAPLAWHPFPNAHEYRVTVTTPAGDVVAEKITSDTTVAFSSLTPGASFRWFVTTALEDGSGVSSPVNSFVAK
jgi:hypothetical protein